MLTSYEILENKQKDSNVIKVKVSESFDNISLQFRKLRERNSLIAYFNIIVIPSSNNNMQAITITPIKKTKYNGQWV